MGKLTGKTSWFRGTKKEAGRKVEDDQTDRLGSPRNGANRRSVETKLKQEVKTTTKDEKKIRVANPLFIPPTKNSKLVARIKMEEERMGLITGWKWRVVESGGCN